MTIKIEEFADTINIRPQDIYDINIKKYAEKLFENLDVSVLLSDSSDDSDDMETNNNIDHAPLRTKFEAKNSIQYIHDD